MDVIDIFVMEKDVPNREINERNSIIHRTVAKPSKPMAVSVLIG